MRRHPSILSLILSSFTYDLPQQFNKFTFSLRGVGGRTVALELLEGTGMFCSSEAYIIAKSIVIRGGRGQRNVEGKETRGILA